MKKRDLEERLKQIRRVPAPESLDRRMEALFDDSARRDAGARRPWRLPAWAAAAAVFILAVSFFLRGGPGPEPVVVEIAPDGRLERFLLGGEPSPPSAGLAFFTRGDCSLETVWPADAPGLDRRPTGGGTGEGDR